MVSPNDTPKVRCVHCRTEISITDQYAHGDHIKCGDCGTKHKVVRGDILRLVLADVTPLQEALRANEQHVERLEHELAGARASFGIGANGFGIAVVYLVYQVAINKAAWTAGLLAQGIALGLLSGALLEAANWLFLAKRQRIIRLTAEIEEISTESARLRQLIRDTRRV
jgi:DNA-directed RNA polymerase subunit RPC12/RpoP